MGILDVMMGGGASGASSGWSKVGEALGLATSGQQPGGSKIYQESMSRGHDMQRKLAEAKIKTDELNAREANEAAISKLFPEGDPRGGALSNVMRAGFGNFDQGTQGLGNIQDMGLKDKALAAMTGGEGGMDAAKPALGNAILAVMEGKPVDLTKISGGTAYNPMVAPDDAQLQITPEGERELGIKDARMRSQNATDVMKANRPSTGRNSSIPDQRAKWYAAELKKAAQQALTQAKLKGYDVSGLSLADAMAAMEANGEFETLDGHVMAKWDIQESDLQAESDDDVALDESQTKAEPGAEVVEPKVSQAGTTAPRPKASPAAVMAGEKTGPVPVSVRIQQAKKALAAGKDPAQVRQMLGSMGIDPAAVGL